MSRLVAATGVVGERGRRRRRHPAGGVEEAEQGAEPEEHVAESEEEDMSEEGEVAGETIAGGRWLRVLIFRRILQLHLVLGSGSVPSYCPPPISLDTYLMGKSTRDLYPGPVQPVFWSGSFLQNSFLDPQKSQ